jgi:hypothetical protein
VGFFFQLQQLFIYLFRAENATQAEIQAEIRTKNVVVFWVWFGLNKTSLHFAF